LQRKCINNYVNEIFCGELFLGQPIVYMFFSLSLSLSLAHSLFLSVYSIMRWEMEKCGGTCSLLCSDCDNQCKCTNQLTDSSIGLANSLTGFRFEYLDFSAFIGLSRPKGGIRHCLNVASMLIKWQNTKQPSKCFNTTTTTKQTTIAT